MGHYDSKLPLWKIAQNYTLADNFFMGHFGGSFSCCGGSVVGLLGSAKRGSPFSAGFTALG